MIFVMWICNGALRYYRAKQQTQTSGIKYQVWFIGNRSITAVESGLVFFQDLETANRQLEDKTSSSRSPL
jgi:hypothetical protein